MASVEDGQVFIVSSLPGGGRGCIPDEGILKHLFGLTLVHYRELVCLQDVIVGSGFAVAHYPSSKHTNSR